MKFLRIDLLTLLISLFILGSCKNPDTVGLGVDPAASLQSNLIDTTTIVAVTDTDNTVVSNNVIKSPLAYFMDPIFGRTEANIAAAVNLPALTAFTSPLATAGTTVSIDSVVLVLKYADGFYGDSLNTNYKLNVYQLQQPLVSSQTYTDTTNVGYDKNTLLGTQVFKPRPKTKVSIVDIVTGAKDTVKKVLPQIRMRLNSQFFYNNFFSATTSQLTTNTIFQNRIKGLYITLDQSQTTGGPGGTMFFNISQVDTNSRIDIYSKSTAAGVIDTTVTSLSLGLPHAVKVKHTYTTSIKNQLRKPTDSIFLQGLSGLRAKLAFPFLSQQRLLHDLRQQSYRTNPKIDTLSITDVTINRAELVVTPLPGTDIPFPPLSRLTFYRFDIANQRVVVPDANPYDARYLTTLGVYGFGGFYDKYKTPKSYSFIISGYIEDLIRGKLKDYGTFIAPADTVRNSSGIQPININNDIQVAARTVVGGGKKTSPYRMKLNIIYNKVTK
jgi:hypothetical protein